MATNRTKRKDIGSFIQSITTLHGTAQFTHKKGRSLVLWSVAVMGNVVLTVIFILVIRGRYNNNQVVTRINANCKVSQVPFPAVSICNFNMVSFQETSIVNKILNQYNRSEEEIQSFFQNLNHLKDFDIIAERNQNFTEIVALLKEHYFTIENIMEEVHQKCDKLLLLCTFNGKVKNCNNFFSLVKTYEGYCCTFNYAALNDNKDPQWSKDDDIEYYEDPSAGDVKSNGGIIITSQSGRGSGLSVVLNVDPEDYPVWTRLPYYGAKVLISDPNDYPETTVLYKYVSIGESLDIKVEPRLFQCENDVRRVEPLKRSCWFHDEVVLEHTDRYSYETCKTECRMQNFLKYCGCIPYKYPAEASKRTCEFKDLPCLSNYRAYVPEDQKSCDPICLPECRDKKYGITSDSMPLLREGLPSNVIEGRNVSDLAALQVYFAKSTSNCYKLTLLMDFNYFIATYGGIFSLSFGASVLTLFEIAFLILRAAFNILNRQAQQVAVKIQKARAKKIKAQSIGTRRKWDNTRY